MKLTKIAIHLEYYNEWRRDNSLLPRFKQPNPKQLGLTIDNAVKVLELLKKFQATPEFRAKVHKKLERPRNTTMNDYKLYDLVIETLIEELENDE